MFAGEGDGIVLGGGPRHIVWRCYRGEVMYRPPLGDDYIVLNRRAPASDKCFATQRLQLCRPGPDPDGLIPHEEHNYTWPTHRHFAPVTCRYSCPQAQASSSCGATFAKGSSTRWPPQANGRCASLL